MPVRRKLALLSALAYAASLFLPGLAPREANPWGFDGYPGFQCLLFGWSTMVAGWKFFLPWTANLFYLPALFLGGFDARPPRWGALLALAGLALGATAFRIDSVLVNEAGNRVAAGLGLGGWLWLASFALLAPAFLLPGGRDAPKA